MVMEQKYGSFLKDIDKLKNTKRVGKENLTYEEAYKKIRADEKINKYLAKDIEENERRRQNDEVVIKDKDYFRKTLAHYTKMIEEAYVHNNFEVKDMTSKDFIKKAVQEMAGMDVIAPLYFDENVTDIYCLAWNKIYFESKKFATPQKSEITFRNAKHYADFIERQLRTAGAKTLDNGENKVIDFDLYGDRYNAISKAVSPNDFALTMRKHSEEHITLDNLIDWGCMSKEVADLMGTLILGECNLIVAGVTGSGKTTTMRAILDHYVTQANKRMLVCEDTRELFPKNDHTLELQTSNGKTEKATDSLRD